VILLSGLVGLGGAGDVFAKAVEGDEKTLGAEDAGGAEGVFNAGTRYKPGRHAVAEGRTLGESAKSGITGKSDECRAEQGHFLPN
jgi:hypothetical protein